MKPLPLILLCCLLFAGCFESQEETTTKKPEAHLQPLALELQTPKQAGDTKIALGQKLFFSPDLSADGTVSCATCHHPDFAGGDGLALPVGVGVGITDATLVGEKRLEALKAHTPHFSTDLVPRNSPSVINIGFYQQRLFWDGRAQFTDDGKLQAGLGLNKYNPENYQQQSLLQAQARMPLTSVFEMKGGKYPSFNNRSIENMLVQLLQQNPSWCSEFNKVYGYSDCQKNIRLGHITEALAAFQNSLVFISTPFSQYMAGDKNALSFEQKQGALDFFTPLSEGGAGCVQCHSGGFLLMRIFIT